MSEDSMALPLDAGEVRDRLRRQIIEDLEAVGHRHHEALRAERRRAEASRSKLRLACGALGHIWARGTLWAAPERRCCAICGEFMPAGEGAHA